MSSNPTDSRLRTGSARESAKRRARAHRILVVDDNQVAANSFAEVLRLDRHEVKTALDGVLALEVAAEFQPEFIFLDLSMPRMDGVTVCRKIREQSAFVETKMIAMTGWAKESEKENILAVGFDYYFVKPIELADVRDILTKSEH